MTTLTPSPHLVAWDGVKVLWCHLRVPFLHALCTCYLALYRGPRPCSFPSLAVRTASDRKLAMYQRLSPNTHRSYKDLEKSLLLGQRRFQTENSASTILLLATVQVGYKCLTLCCHILMVAMVKACYMCVTSDTIHLLCQRYCVQ